MKKAALFTVLFILSPFVVIYLTSLKPSAIWVWFWIGLWFWFVNSKQDIFNRGLIFIVASVTLTIGGQLYLDGKEDKHIIEMISQIFLIIGGGVGGNFMAHHFLSKKNA